METMKHIIIDDCLDRIGDELYGGYLAHAYCHAGSCRFEYWERAFVFEKGDCMIVPGRGDLIRNLSASRDFRVDVVYVTREFIEVSTPQSNYGMQGHLSLFNNPVMKLRPEQQERCAANFNVIRHRLSQPEHHFFREIMINAIQCMILDFFDFHVSLYGENKISSQSHQLMEQFLDLLEQGEFRQNREIGYYARKLCVTPKYLSEVCKKTSGLPAAYWIARYTSLDISRLLRDKSLSFTRISDMFGFTSLSHFSRYVQKNLGVKPSDFRE